ncbi:translocation/assembly module TamB domain-containing protein [Rhodocaloribacter litoris]|uniref:translocation/assembly module TamB n=1 Tax=Rhodocaloribacter litoris TaxID=2558931 RepID=UPI00141E7479|nr:translocation/assembly module TamB [Rhodocaloribacter litoris]QXD16501.1 translocation/assembly module TamB domain-containing protein [Rhodocaloribacter litoris]
MNRSRSLPSPEVPDPGPPPRPGVVRWLVRGVGWGLGGVLGLLALVLLLFQTEWGATRMVRFVLDRLSLFEGAHVEVGRVQGNLISRLTLYDVELVQGDTLRLVHVDTVTAHYRLWPVFRKTLHFERIEVVNPAVSMAQQEDASWNLLNVLPADTTAPDTATPAFSVIIDRLHLRGGQARARFYAPGRDSLFVLGGLDVRMDSLRVAGAIMGSLDTLSGVFVPPGLNTPVTLRLGAQLGLHRLELRGLELVSDRSRLTARGVLPRFGAPPGPDSLDFTLAADPLHLGDVALFVPTLDPRLTMTGAVRAGGTFDLTTLSVAVQTSDGGTIRLDGRLTPRLADSLRYQVNAQVRGLDLSRYAGPDVEALLQGEVHADLHGPALDRLAGMLRATVSDTRLAGERIDRATLETTFDDGQARLVLDSGVRGTGFTVRGTLRPFDDVPAYDLTAAVHGLDLRRFTGDSTRTGTLGGTLRLTGRGLDPRTADLTARLVLDPSTVGAARIEQGRLTARLLAGTATFETHLATAEGSLDVAGRLRLGDTPAYEVQRGRVENLDYLAFLAGPDGYPVVTQDGDTTRSTLSGTFTLAGRGASPATLDLQAEARLRNTSYGVYALEEGEARASLRQGVLRLAAEARLRGGTVTLDGHMRPFAATPTFTLDEVAFRHVDLRALARRPDFETDLNGRLTLEGRGLDPATMHLAARLDLDASRINAQHLRSATLQAVWSADTLAYRLALDLPEGYAEVAGTARDLTGTPVYVVRTGAFAGLDAGAFLGREGARTDLNGRFTLEGRGLDPATMHLAARLDLDASRINAADLPGGTLEAEVDGGQARLTARFEVAGGDVRLDAAGRFSGERPTFTARGRAQRLDLGRLAGLDTLRAGLNLAFEVEGEGLDPATMRLDGRLALGPSRYHEVVLDSAYTRFTLHEGLARVDTLVLQSNVGTLHGYGPVALFDTAGVHASDFVFAADLVAAYPLQPLVGVQRLLLGSGRLEGRLAGRPGTLRFDTRLTLSGFVYNDVRVAGLEARLLGEFDRNRRLARAELRSGIDFFSLPTLAVEQTRIQATYRPEALDFEVNTRLDRRRDGFIGGSIDLVPGQSRLTLDTLYFRFDRDRWRLQQPATLDYGEGRYRIRNLLLYAREAGDGDITQQIALDGEIDLNGTQSLILTIERFRLGAVADLLGYQGLGGRLDGWLVLEGTPADPVADGSLDFDLTLSGEAVGDMTATLHYEQLRLALEARLTDEHGSALTLGGSLPMDLRLAAGRTGETAADRRVDLTLVTDDFALNWLMPFMDRELVDVLEGRLTADVRVEGTFEEPVFAGTAFVRDGRLGLPLLGRPRSSLVYSGIALEAELQGNQILVHHVEAHSGGGTLIGHGTIDFSQLTLGAFDLSLSAENFLAIDSRAYRARAAADLVLQGTTRSPVLSGDVELVSADIFLTEEVTSEDFETVRLAEEDLQTLERRFGLRLTEADTTTFDFYEALTITNLRVRMERDTWLRSKKNPTMDVQFTGNLEVQKQPYGDPLVFGTIAVIPERSRIIQFGKRFDIQQGTLTFNGPATDPIMDIEAQYVVRARGSSANEVTITLSVEGRLDELDVTLGSDPQMEFADIVSYLAFGRPAGEALQLGRSGGGGSSLLDPAAGLALGQIAGLIENLAGTGLGLDVIEIEQNGLEGATLTAGKYVSPRLYVAISQPIAFRQSGTAFGEEVPTQVTLEYEVIDRLLIRLLRRGAVIRVNLKWEYAY